MIIYTANKNKGSGKKCQNLYSNYVIKYYFTATFVALPSTFTM